VVGGGELTAVPVFPARQKFAHSIVLFRGSYQAENISALTVAPWRPTGQENLLIGSKVRLNVTHGDISGSTYGSLGSSDAEPQASDSDRAKGTVGKGIFPQRGNHGRYCRVQDIGDMTHFACG